MRMTNLSICHIILLQKKSSFILNIMYVDLRTSVSILICQCDVQ